jgi:serine/tyrosine/threonine adenylyltransferase
MQWNLTRLAETLLPLLADEEEAAIEQAQEALASFAPQFEQAYHSGLMRKLGLFTTRDGDVELARDVLSAMTQNQVDFTLFFRRLADAETPGSHDEPLRALFVDPTACDALLVRWRERIAQETGEGGRRDLMRLVNPAYIPRNHRIEAMIKSAVEEGDFVPFEELLTVLARPYDDQPEWARYMDPPQEHERVRATFCGT